GNLSRGGLNEIQQQTEERGFSGSVVSDQAEALSFLDMQIVNLQNRVSVISFAEIFYFYHLKKFVVQVCHSVFRTNRWLFLFFVSGKGLVFSFLIDGFNFIEEKVFEDQAQNSA